MKPEEMDPRKTYQCQVGCGCREAWPDSCCGKEYEPQSYKVPEYDVKYEYERNVVLEEAQKKIRDAAVRKFETGATRDTDDGKLDYEGFLSPWVLRRYAEYMHKNRTQSNGSVRDSDNWQKGIPKDAYMKSLLRHTQEVWEDHRYYKNDSATEDALCAIIFNAMGYLFESMHERAGYRPSKAYE